MREYGLKKLTVKYQGIFDFDRIYQYFYEWLHDRKYRTNEPKHKEKPESPWGWEREVRIFSHRKVDDYYKYDIKIFMHVRDGEEVEVDGKTLMRGRIKIDIVPSVTVDYQGRFEKNRFTKWLEQIYTEHIINREIDLNHLDEMHYRMHELQQKVKKMLNMYADENYYKGA